MIRRHSIGYDLYLGSPLWHFRRWLWFVTSLRKCERCGWPLVLHKRDIVVGWGWIAGRPIPRVLSVHHKHYRTLYRERRCDVELLCDRCHWREDAWRRR